MSRNGNNWDEECSVIGDTADIGFIDYQDDRSVCSYNPDEEGPVIVSVPFPFVSGKPRSVLAGETAVESITVRNTTSEAVELWMKIYASTPENSFTLSLMEPPRKNDAPKKRGFLELYALEDRMLQPHETLTIWLSCKAQEIGLYTTVLYFDVGNDRIERVAFLLAEDKVSQSLTSKNPYSRTTKKKQFSVDQFVRGSRPAAKVPQRQFKNRLPRYDIPKEVRELVQGKEVPDAIMAGLSSENYAPYFKMLLMMEEFQLEEDMRTYGMESVSLRKRGNFLCLVVPGLAERRPSLVHGDSIFAKRSDAAVGTIPYEGYIHRVEADEISLRFDPEFHHQHMDGNLYDVHFTYNRVNMRRLYFSIDAAEGLGEDILFPSWSSGNRVIGTTPLVPISCSLNEEQMISVEMILGCKGGSPYVIHGPPGTGKTKTIVEAILQLYRYRKGARILVCAPSNSAADHLLEKLLNEEDVNIRDNEIFRLNAPSRPYDDVHPDHIRFCFFDDHIFKCPPLGALAQYRIVISTYMSASLLYAEDVKRGHFTHIFLDEAGQASEPETMIPLSKLCRRDTVVVLAGDPMQLGPVVYSRDAEGYGLGKSYLERLFECECYCNGDENFVTKLIKNYRCEPEILSLPSSLFYNGELMACKEVTDDSASLMALINLIPGKSFSVIFLGIQGCDEREGTNPSWFNRIEASKVVEVIRKLSTRGNLCDDDIGVITPYKQQVNKIKKALDDLDMPDIKVGSVEQFQGQEKKVIIVSTVRSTIKHKEFDKVHCLGFLSNPRRFNVALTRAKSLLIIIGNPHIISKDRNWNKLLWYCVENESYQGCTLPEKPVDEDEYQEPEGYPAYTDEYTAAAPGDDDAAGWGDPETVGGQIPKPGTDEAEWSDGWK